MHCKYLSFRICIFLDPGRWYLGRELACRARYSRTTNLGFGFEESQVYEVRSVDLMVRNSDDEE